MMNRAVPVFFLMALASRAPARCAATARDRRLVPQRTQQQQ